LLHPPLGDHDAVLQAISQACLAVLE